MNKFLESYFKIIRRIIPQKPEGTSVGLDIGAGDCKLIELRKGENSFELVNWAIEPVKGGDVADAIKRCLEHLENPCKILYTSVFGKGTLIRYIDMPLMSLEDLRNSFEIEADKYFPFSQDQIYTDCYILETYPKKKKMSVLAAAVKREMVDGRVKLLTDLGLPVDFIGINPIALVNVLCALSSDEDGPKNNAATALLDLGESVSNLTIVLNEMPRFTRDIFIGGRDISKRISNALGISFQEAEKLKSDPKDKKEEVARCSESELMSIVQELRLSFDYFSTDKNCEITKLYLTGGGAKFEGIVDVFKKNLEISVEKWNPIKALRLSSDLSEEDINKNSLKLGVAIGLALNNYD